MNECYSCTSACTHTFTSPATPSPTSIQTPSPLTTPKKGLRAIFSRAFHKEAQLTPPSMHSTTLTTTTAAQTTPRSPNNHSLLELPKPSDNYLASGALSSKKERTRFDFKLPVNPSPPGTPINVLVTPESSPVTLPKASPSSSTNSGPLKLARSWSNQSTTSSNFSTTTELPANIDDLWKELNQRTLATMQDKGKSPKAREYSPNTHRFPNIPLFETTAVMLDEQYLHANQVTSSSSSLFQSSETIIASQYPLEKEDVRALFWRSVLKNECSLIIDLTQRVSNEESEQQYQLKQIPYPYFYEKGLIPYYPWETEDLSQDSSQEPLGDNDSQTSLQESHKGRITYGNVTVTCKKAKKLWKNQVEMGIEKCKYYVHDKTPGSPRDSLIKRIHVYNWQDHKPNESLDQILRLIDVLEQRSSKSTLLHCRAGMGRTGTVISLYFMCKRMREKRDVTLENMGNILIDIVYELRMQRGPIFVQSFDQFKQLYTCSIIKWREYQKYPFTPSVSPSQGDKEYKDD